MSSLKSRFIADLTAAMKARDELKTSTLRLLKAEIMKLEVSGTEKIEVSDEQSVTIINRLIKQRKESAEQFRKGGREELAQKEEAETEILKIYLPEQLSEAELEKIVRETAETLGVKDPSGTGKLMGAVMVKVKGKADGGRVKEAVGKLLGG